jgi:hypothetical protein
MSWGRAGPWRQAGPASYNAPHSRHHRARILPPARPPSRIPPIRPCAGRRGDPRAAVVARGADRPDLALHRRRRRQAHPAAPGAAVCRGPGLRGPERFELAATVEFIHTATLLHDDVVDESSLRRGRATANAIFGNAASVLVGDFLYSRAFQMMVSVNRMRVLEVLADATNVIAEGEVLQLMNMHDPDLSVEDYLQVIRFKTAKLFEASARLGAVLAAPTRSRRPAPATAARWARPSSWWTTCSTTKATPTNWARTSATTCAKASPPCRCWWRWSAGHEPNVSLIRHAIEHGESAEAARDPGHRAAHRRAGRHARGRQPKPTRPAQLLSALPRRGPRGSARIMCSVGSPLFLSSGPGAGLARTLPPSGCSLAW